MTARDFCFWLQGYIEIVAANPAPTGGLTPSQLACVGRHLNLVFAHDIDPQAGGPEAQAKLGAIHDGPTLLPFLNDPRPNSEPRPRC